MGVVMPSGKCGDVSGNNQVLNSGIQVPTVTVWETWAQTQNSVGGGETSDSIGICDSLGSPVTIDVIGGTCLLLQKYNCPLNIFKNDC